VASGRQPAVRGPAGGPITILLVDDHTLVREGLRRLLDAEPDFAVVGESQDGREALSMAAALDPDVIVMDIAMPELNGIEATRQLQNTAPRSRVLILSGHGEIQYVDRLVALGALGFVLKQAPVSELLAGIRATHLGRAFLSAAIRMRVAVTPAEGAPQCEAQSGCARPPTVREAEVLQLVAEGYGNKGIAVRLGISIKTVEKHRSSLMKKLDLHDVASLVRYALSEGIIEGTVQAPPR